MLTGESVAEMARKMAKKEAAHLEELAHARKLTILIALGALVIGVMIGLAI